MSVQNAGKGREEKGKNGTFRIIKLYLGDAVMVDTGHYASAKTRRAIQHRVNPNVNLGFG